MLESNVALSWGQLVAKLSTAGSKSVFGLSKKVGANLRHVGKTVIYTHLSTALDTWVSTPKTTLFSSVNRLVITTIHSAYNNDNNISLLNIIT